MKKIIMMVAAVLMLSVPASMAQKVNAGSYKSKLAKSDEVITNAKKASKASTWISRGNDYFDALQAPTASVYVGMDEAMFKLTCGEPQSTSTEAIRGAEHTVYVYPYFTAYIAGGKVVAWKVTKQIYDGAEKVAIEAFDKAYQLEKDNKKVKEGLDRIANYFFQIGDSSNTLSDYKVGGEAYETVFNVQSHPACNNANSTMLYYSGYMYTIGGAENPELYDLGVKSFLRAIEAGYPEEELASKEIEEKEKGNIFYYLYHCYYGRKDVDSSNVQKAKDALIKGVEMFPKNLRIIDALVQLYTTEEGMGDPSELVDMIDAAIDEDPANADLWFARGRIYFALKDYDNCIESFAKVTEIAPDVFDGHFYLGLFYIYKGDEMNELISNKTYTENAAYAKDIEETNAVYAAAVPILERAHELKPTDLVTVEYLKSLCFRLRDEEGIMDKYTKYNTLYNEMKANE